MWAPIAGKVGASAAEKWKETRQRGHENRERKVKSKRRHIIVCYMSSSRALQSSPHESSSVALYHGWPSSNFSAISAGNSASLGGSWKRFRDQWSGGLQRRPRAHTSLIQDSLRAIACLKNEPRETETRYWVWTFFNIKLLKNGRLPNLPSR